DERFLFSRGISETTKRTSCWSQPRLPLLEVQDTALASSENPIKSGLGGRTGGQWPRESSGGKTEAPEDTHLLK
ncbi:hypothetical protein JRQ81_017779, partial [Phrynocephalus forsythii]